MHWGAFPITRDHVGTGSPEIPVLDIWGGITRDHGDCCILVSLRTSPSPTRSTPENIDLADSTPALNLAFFGREADSRIAKYYYVVNTLRSSRQLAASG